MIRESGFSTSGDGKDGRDSKDVAACFLTGAYLTGTESAPFYPPCFCWHTFLIRPQLHDYHAADDRCFSLIG